jgi:hypothetical protein
VKVFWSWQSDTPGKIGRHFVREALATAVTELKVEAEVEEPEGRDPRCLIHLDQDRQGVPGSPDLARIILDKISRAAVFVADVTPVGVVTTGCENAPDKKLINANVAIELGYALGTIGDEALLMVMNEHFGGRDELPFDLKAKAGPLLFRLQPSATKEELGTASRRLVAQLKEAIALCLQSKVEAIQVATPIPAAAKLKREIGQGYLAQISPYERDLLRMLLIHGKCPSTILFSAYTRVPGTPALQGLSIINPLGLLQRQDDPLGGVPTFWVNPEWVDVFKEELFPRTEQTAAYFRGL